jgi:hypothetical protein
MPSQSTILTALSAMAHIMLPVSLNLFISTSLSDMANERGLEWILRQALLSLHSSL